MENSKRNSEINPHKDREWVIERYFEDLNLTESKLQGKRVLDIGSGEDCFFADYCREKGIADVYPIDLGLHGEGGQKVVATGVSLPFKDEMFDLVFSENAVPSCFYNFPGTEQMKEMSSRSIDEMLRVTKPGGEIRFYPIYKNWHDYSGSLFGVVFHFLRQKLEKLVQAGVCQIEFKESKPIDIYRIKRTPVMVRIIKMPH